MNSSPFNVGLPSKWLTERRFQLELEARALIDVAFMAGYDRVCWKYDTSYDTWSLGQWIVMLSDIVGYPIHGGYDMGAEKDHGNLNRYQGHEPIPGKTLYL
ncbi:hypothetical protein LCGC14_1491980 [marine sediment metagenome]|uniref:Uncharacterized protein n=1 Tax=marine sediment metagenome TaxID=412755 RepID=A0A0F9JSF2_9ZZZZ